MDNVLVWIYVAEAVLKIIGLGIRVYFSDGWNVLDFVVTVISVLTIALANSGSLANAVKASKSNRALRLARVIFDFEDLCIRKCFITS